jgi:hypothetical protein
MCEDIILTILSENNHQIVSTYILPIMVEKVLLKAIAKRLLRYDYSNVKYFPITKKLHFLTKNHVKIVE